MLKTEDQPGVANFLDNTRGMRVKGRGVFGLYTLKLFIMAVLFAFKRIYLISSASKKACELA